MVWPGNNVKHLVSIEEQRGLKLEMKYVSPAEFQTTKHIEILYNNFAEYPKYFLQITDAKLINASRRGNELYGIDTRTTLTVKYPNGLEFTFFKGTPNLWRFSSVDTQRSILKILYYCDPSTGRSYVSFVPEHFNMADSAMAWKFCLTDDEYSGLEAEA